MGPHATRSFEQLQIPSALTEWPEWPVAQRLLLPRAKKHCKSRPARAKCEALLGNLRLPSSCLELQISLARDIPRRPWVGPGRRLYSGMYGLLTLLCTWIYTRQDIYKSPVLSPSGLSGLSPNDFCCHEQRSTASRGLPEQNAKHY